MNNLIIDIHGTRRDILESIGRDFDADIERLEESTKIDSVIHDKINEGYDGFIIVTKDTDKAQKYFEKKFSNIDIAVCSPDGKMSLREVGVVPTQTAQTTAAAVANTAQAATQQTAAQKPVKNQQPVNQPNNKYDYYINFNPASLKEVDLKSIIEILDNIGKDQREQIRVHVYYNYPQAPFKFESLIALLERVYKFNASKIKQKYKNLIIKHNNGYMNKCQPAGYKAPEKVYDTITVVNEEIKKLGDELTPSEDSNKILQKKDVVLNVQHYLCIYNDCLKNKVSPDNENSPGRGLDINWLNEAEARLQKVEDIARDLGLGGAIDTFNDNVLDTKALGKFVKDAGHLLGGDKNPKNSNEKKSNIKNIKNDKIKWHYTKHAKDLYMCLYKTTQL